MKKSPVFGEWYQITEGEIAAIEKVAAYCFHDERDHYDTNPCDKHIYLDIVRLFELIRRLRS